MDCLASSYIHFLKNVVSSDAKNVTDIIAEHTTSNVKKIVNNETVCENVEGLSEQLISVREMAGRIDINLVNFCNDLENNKCSVRYMLDSELAGNFSTLAIVTYDDNKKIVEIDEIYTSL